MTSDISSETSPIETIVSNPRDPDFYFNDLTVFEVENVLFRVPRQPFLAESEIFRDMFLLPPTDEGSDDDHPLILHGISVKHFRALLKVFFVRAYGAEAPVLTQDEWNSMLHLTHIWNFERLFNLAIEKLDSFPIDPITRILLARPYSVTKWLRPAYFTLVMRTDALTLEEAEKLGIDCAIKLAKVRELRFRWIIDDAEAEAIQSTVFNFAPSTTAYSRPIMMKGKGKKSVYGPAPIVYISQPDPLSEQSKFIERLEAAVHSALTDVFGLNDH